MIPLAEPGVWRRLPGWLLDPLGPLAVRWRYLPSLAPWLARFALASRPARVAALTRALAALLNRAAADYAPLVAQAGLDGMWRRHGALTLYRDAAELEQALPAWRRKAEHGVAWQTLDRSAAQACEPMLQDGWERAVKVAAWSMLMIPICSAAACSTPSSPRAALSSEWKRPP